MNRSRSKLIRVFGVQRDLCHIFLMLHFAKIGGCNTRLDESLDCAIGFGGTMYLRDLFGFLVSHIYMVSPKSTAQSRGFFNSAYFTHLFWRKQTRINK